MAPTPEVSGHGAEAATPPLPPASLPAGSLSTSRAEEIICPSAMHPGVGSGSSGPLLASLAATSLGGGSGDDSEGNYCINLVSACAAWKMQMPSWRMHTCVLLNVNLRLLLLLLLLPLAQPLANKTQLSAAIVADTLAALPVTPAAVSNVQGPALEVHKAWRASALPCCGCGMLACSCLSCCAVLCCAAFHCLGRVRAPRLLSCAGGVCTSPTTPHAA